MTQAFRLTEGGRIDRARPLTIRFDGRVLPGFAGDTVASILLANGVHLAGRSFKYHRPRGILSHGADEPSALITVDRGPGRVEPNARASTVAASDGLVVRSQNRFPSLQFDLGSVAGLVSPVLAAGFYYKTFMWPRGFWDRVYEPLIRRAAGLGRAPDQVDPDRYANRHAHCDVLVVGAGPAGIAAALAESASGQRVILADEQEEMGGALLHDLASEIDGLPASAWLEQALDRLRACPEVIPLPRTTAFGHYNHGHVALAERRTDHLAVLPPGQARERLWQVRARRVVLATGAHERPLVFPGNDLPGIMLADSLAAFINRWAVRPGQRVVFVTSGTSAYGAAMDALAAGMDVTIVDLRDEAACGPERDVAVAAGIEVLAGHAVLRATGRQRVAALHVAAPGGAPRILPCDCVGMSGGWTPSVHLFSQSRGRLRFDPALDAFLPGTPAQATTCVGAAAGEYELSACTGLPATRSWTGFQPATSQPGTGRWDKAFVDFQNDVTAKDLALAVREGFHAIEHVKRYTTAGMATDQGKGANMNTLGLVAAALGKTKPEVGTTTFRPPYTPTSFGTLTAMARGALFDPVRATPIHDWAAARGAAFEDVGLWRRAWFFPQHGETQHQAVARECLAVRNTVGLFDASTLGKIEVVGPDAAAFLDRLYPGALLKLAPGRCRYALMLREDGYVMDDGIVARLDLGRFHVTTTTTGAARVLNHMEDYRQTEWPDLDVFLTSITEQWAVIAVQGPLAREVIAPLVEGTDLSNAAFPHMSVRDCTVCGVPARLFRASFTGELGYEINVPSSHGLAVWEAVWAQGQAHGITAYGTEAMHVLRAEKGYPIVGQDTDGTVTPDDLGMAGLVSSRKPDFVGKRSLARPDLVAPGRLQLVGLLTEDPALLLDVGAQIVAAPDHPVPVPMLGHVTSAYASPACGRSIALALLADGRARHGQVLHVTTQAGFTTATVCGPVFYDVEGARVHG